MDGQELYARLFTSFAAGLAVLVAGAGNALVGSRRGWVRAIVVATGGLAGTGVAAALVPGRVPLFAAVTAVAAAVVWLAGSARVRALVAAAARAAHGRVAWAGLAAVGVVGIALAVWQYGEADSALSNRQLGGLAAELGAVTSTPTGTGYTDRGAAVPLETIADPLSAQELSEQEAVNAAITSHAFKVIRTAPADDACNCHGWVFTGGKFRVGGTTVPQILADNGYAVVSAPRASDLCVYHDGLGNVTHSAVVLAVMADGGVLVEGKWGRMGVYMHLAEDSGYGTDFQFFHSERAGHLLGLTPPKPSASATGGNADTAATAGGE